MSNFNIKVLNLAGTVQGSLTTVSGTFKYTDKLKGINKAQVIIPSLGSVRKGLIVEGTRRVQILRDGTVEFDGIIQGVDTLDAGGTRINLVGREVQLDDEKGAYANSPYTSTASATIADDILTESTKWSAGTHDAGSNIDFRISTSSSLWDALSNLAEFVSQDIEISYTGVTATLKDHKGSSTSVATLNDKSDIVALRYTTGRPQANYVVVRGKGDGANQIVSTSANGQDATSQTTYGVIKKVITNLTVNSVAEANRLANAEVARLKDPTKLYFFSVINPNLSVVSGDVLTLNSGDKGLTNESVRVVKVTRGLSAGVEFLKLQVTNSAYSRLVKSRDEVIRGILKNRHNDTNYMQGGPNVLAFSGMQNCTLGQPLVISFNLDADQITDEAGNINVNTFEIDYDIDPYRKGVGSATDSGHTHNLSARTAPSNTLRSVYVTSGSRNGSFGVTNGIVKLKANIDTGTTYDFNYITVNFVTTGTLGSGTLSWRVYNETKAATVFTNSQGVGADVWVSDGYPDSSSNINLSIGDWLRFDITGVPPSATISDATMTLTIEKDHTHSMTAQTGGAQTSTAVVTIGDDANDVGSVNSTGVDIYLDFWNTGTSTWDNKHSILATGKTLDTGVDISNAGTYPNAAGLWRVRVDPNSNSPDLVKAIVRVKHPQES